MSEQKTTATLRQEAAAARRAGRYADAARLFREAVAAYPGAPDKLGQLGRRDLAALEEQAAACEHMARPLVYVWEDTGEWFWDDAEVDLDYGRCVPSGPFSDRDAARADAEYRFRCAVRTERGRPPHHEDDISAA